MLPMCFGVHDQINFQTCFISGMCRVGKTLLGTIVSSCKNVEYCEEPWGIMFLPKLSLERGIDDSLLKSMFATHIKWLFDEVFLMRGANFRPNDLSFIGKKKTCEEISDRFFNFSNATDVMRVSSKSTFVINLTENCKDFNFYFESIPSCRIIYVIRHALGVAYDVMQKQWFSRESLSNPAMPQLFKKFHGIYLPFWVNDDDAEYFLSLNDFEKGLYYYAVMSEQTFSSINFEQSNVLLVKYEDLVNNAYIVLSKVEKFLNVQKTLLTAPLIESVRKTNNTIEAYETSKFLRARVNNVLEKFGYSELI